MDSVLFLFTCLFYLLSYNVPTLFSVFLPSFLCTVYYYLFERSCFIIFQAYVLFCMSSFCMSSLILYFLFWILEKNIVGYHHFWMGWSSSAAISQVPVWTRWTGEQNLCNCRQRPPNWGVSGFSTMLWSHVGAFILLCLLELLVEFAVALLGPLPFQIPQMEWGQKAPPQSLWPCYCFTQWSCILSWRKDWW